MQRLVMAFSFLTLATSLPAADPVIGHGLTNFAIGDAQVNPNYDYGTYQVTGLGSNGLDGVSIRVGEPDAGVFLTPYTSYVQDGDFMIAKSYGHLNGTNDALMVAIQGGRASDTTYPLRFDFSPLAPESVTYQIFANGTLQREFTRGNPIVTIQWGQFVLPTLNPLVRRSDGSLGMSLVMSQPITFVFPEILRSAYGDELFIRLNNPAHQPGLVSRVDVFGGGRLYDLSFQEIALGVFGRKHRSLN